MNVFLFALTICAAGMPNVMAQDSPAVAAAKAAHFNAVRQAELLIANASPVEKKENYSPVPETAQHQLGVNVQDTPEVAAAKSAHFEAVRKAEHATAVANATGRYQPDVHGHHSTVGHHQAPLHHQSSIHHPTSVHYPTSGHYPSSVHHPTYDHYPVHHSGASYYPSNGHHGSSTYRPDLGHHHSYPSYQHNHLSGGHYYPVHAYSAPVEQVQSTQHKLGVNVEDTPEVAAAKISHFNAVREAAQAAIASNANDDGSYLYSESIPNMSKVTGHLVQEVVYAPVVYQSNTVAPVSHTNQHILGVNVHDTPEVAAAKAAHFAAFRQALLTAANEKHH